MSQRVDEHRAKFNQLLNNPQTDLLNSNDHEGCCLGKHLNDDHHCEHRNDYNNSYKVFILLNRIPRKLDEHKWLQQLKTHKNFWYQFSRPYWHPLKDM